MPPVVDSFDTRLVAAIALVVEVELLIHFGDYNRPTRPTLTVLMNIQWPPLETTLHVSGCVSDTLFFVPAFKIHDEQGINIWLG